MLNISNFTTSDWIAIVGGIAGIFGGIAGIIGALVSGIAAYIAWLAFKRDNAVIKAELTDGLVGNHPNYDEVYLITISNRGRRSFPVASVGLVFLKKKVVRFFRDTNIVSGEKLIKESKSLVYSYDKKQINRSEYSHIFVKDEAQRTFLFSIAPWYKKFFFWFLDITYIKRK